MKLLRLFTYCSINVLFSITMIKVCGSPAKEERHNIDAQLSISSLQTETLEKSAKKDLQLVELSIQKDTLNIVSTSSFIFYPLGKFIAIEKIRQSNPQFATVIEHDKNDKKAKLYRLSSKNSFVKFFKDPNKATLEIVSGKIINPEIMLKNGIRVGMSKINFFNLFFNKMTEHQVNNIKVVKLISALNGITHVYTFENEKLNRLAFDTDYTFDKK
jgi:hypothetical protein